MLHPLLEAIILGLVQGLTEFIPVSSSGHLLLVGELLTFSQNGFAFEVALNIGTLTALLWYFRTDLLSILRSIFVKRDFKLVILLTVATIPAVLAGAFLLSFISTSMRSPFITVAALILVGILMIGSDKLQGKRNIQSIKVVDAFLIGLAQAVALIPGVSRSGATMLAAKSLQLSNEAAARFSFLMAIPIIGGALLRLTIEPEFSGLFRHGLVLAVGIATSFLSGVWAIGFLLKFLQNHGLKWFGVYRIIFGGVVLLLLLIKGNY
jgi:undecaprenyl-diphosphatase